MVLASPWASEKPFSSLNVAARSRVASLSAQKLLERKEIISNSIRISWGHLYRHILARKSEKKTAIRTKRSSNKYYLHCLRVHVLNEIMTRAQEHFHRPSAIPCKYPLKVHQLQRSVRSYVLTTRNKEENCIFYPIARRGSADGRGACSDSDGRK